MKVALKDLYKVDFTRDNDLTFVNGKAFRNGLPDYNLTQYLIKVDNTTFKDVNGNIFKYESANNIYNSFILKDKNAIDVLKELDQSIKYINGDIIIDLPQNMLKDSHIRTAIEISTKKELALLEQSKKELTKQETEQETKQEPKKQHWWNKFTNKEKGE